MTLQPRKLLRVPVAKMTRRIELVANNGQPFPGRLPPIKVVVRSYAIEG